MSSSGEISMEFTVTQGWLERHKDLYRHATRHPFILSIRDGSVDLDCFKRWLGQDYFFVRSFVRFIASLLVKLPKDVDESDIDTILGGLCALEQEISWFRSEALIWDMQLTTIKLQEPNKSYCSFLEELSDAQTDYHVALTALWAIEVVYNDSFAHCLEPGAKVLPELQTACERWGSPQFKAYCISLKKLADKHLQNCSQHVIEQAEKVFLKILAQEIDFWKMSMGNI